MVTVAARFKEVPEPAKALRKVRDHAREILQVLEPRSSARNVLDAAVQAFDATGGAVLEQDGAEARPIYQVGKWDGPAQLSIPLGGGDGVAFRIALGARRSGEAYSELDRAMLQETVETVARAIALAGRTGGAQA